MPRIQRKHILITALAVIAVTTVVGALHREVLRFYHESRLASGDPSVQWGAASALERVATDAARDWYARKVRDGSYEERMRAAGRLQMIGVLPDSPCQGQESHLDRNQATFTDGRINIEPASISFEVPASIARWQQDVGSGIHLGAERLARLKAARGEWDTEFSLIVDSTVALDRCFAHCGNDGWGEEAVAFSDLQLRVYVLEGRGESLYGCLRERAPEAALRIAGPRTQVTEDLVRQWKRLSIAYPRSYGDYGGTASIEFWAMRADQFEIVCVFMYVHDHSGEIEGLMRSMRGPGL